MANRSVFAEQVEQFATVVHALLQDDKTRAAFAKEPLATLKQYGVELDPAIANKIEAELASLATETSEVKWSPIVYATSYPIEFPQTLAITRTQVHVGVGSIVGVVSQTWSENPEGVDNLIKIDKPRVDAFVTEVTLQSTVTLQEAMLATQAARIATQELRIATQELRIAELQAEAKLVSR